MKLILRALLGFSYALIISITLILFFGISDKPELAVAWTLTSNDIARAKKLLNTGAKSNGMAVAALELSPADVNLAANYLLNRYSKSAVQVVLQRNKLKVMLSTTLPTNSLGQYLNISFRIANVNHHALPELVACKVGRLVLPAPLAAWLINRFIQQSSLNQYLILATRHIKSVSITPEKISLYYSANLASLLPNTANTTANQTTLHYYKQHINRLIAQHDSNWLLSLADLLQPLFALAYQRSDLTHAIAENRAIIIAVNDYVNKKETRGFLTEYYQKQPELYYPAYLYKRSDLAQHFIASAALAISVNQQLAQVAGEEKELSDAEEGGSGFSFIDLAADKAGARFAQVATVTPESARQLQQTMANIHDYTAFMPDPTDLPEKMNTDEFKQRYSTVNSAAYMELSNKIEARINAMALYQ